MTDVYGLWWGSMDFSIGIWPWSLCQENAAQVIKLFKDWANPGYPPWACKLDICRNTPRRRRAIWVTLAIFGTSYSVRNILSQGPADCQLFQVRMSLWAFFNGLDLNGSKDFERNSWWFGCEGIPAAKRRTTLRPSSSSLTETRRPQEIPEDGLAFPSNHGSFSLNMDTFA